MHLSLVLEANLGRRGAAPPKQKALGDGQDSGGRNWGLQERGGRWALAGASAGERRGGGKLEGEDRWGIAGGN